MDALNQAIDAYNLQKSEQLPSDVLETMAQATAALKATGIEDRAVRTGDPMSDFVNADYTQRMEPAEIVARLECLAAAA